MIPDNIRIKSKLTHHQFGAKQALFETHVKGKELPVLDYHNGFYTVQVEGDTYTVHKSDIENHI